MDLNSSRVYRNLDAKLKIAGLEAPDLLFVLIFAAIMNLLFGNTNLVFPLVIVLPCLILLILFFGKRNKPDGYLIHLIRYYITAGFFSAAELPSHVKKMKLRINE